MSRGAPLRKVGDFNGDTPKAAAYLEDALVRKMRTDNEAAFGPFTVTDVKTSTYTAKPWELVRCNPTGGAFTVLFPDASAADAGQIIVKNESASATTITVRPLNSTTTTVDGATSYTISAARGCVAFHPDAVGKDWMALVAPSVTSLSMGGEVTGTTAASTVAKLQGKTLDTTAPTLAGQTIYYDGTKWVSGTNTLPYWRSQVANANTVALWQFNPALGVGGLGDSGTHSLTLTAVGSSVARYIEVAPGVSGIILDSLGQFEHAHDANLDITGAITVSCIVTFTEIPASGSNFEYLYTYANTGETQAANYLHSLGVCSFASQAGAQLVMSWEHGAGVDVDVKSVSSVPIYRPLFVTVTRNSAGTSVSFYLNGVPLLTVTGLTAPDTSGSPTEILTIGGDPTRAAPTFQGRAWLGSLHIENVELSAADVLTRYNYVARGIG